MPVYGFLPDSRPTITARELQQFVLNKGINIDFIAHPMWIIGVRGYYLNSMGEVGYNDRGIYDDAIFIFSNECYRSFNANTDPAVRREGIATLKTGLWLVHKFDFHNGEYLALCQRGRNVTVVRDGGMDRASFEDVGLFGINIHHGGYNKVSSIGCQTIYPDQWNEFINTAKDLAEEYFGDEWQNTYIPYALIEKTSDDQ